MSEEKKIGRVAHYFSNIGVAVIELTDTIREGENIHIKGAHTDFEQQAKSMQIEHEDIEEAGAGQSIGLKVKSRVRENDEVFKVL